MASTPELGKFQFRNSNTWIDGALNRSAIQVNFRVKSDADSESLKPLSQMSRFYNSLKGSVPIKVSIQTY